MFTVIYFCQSEVTTEKYEITTLPALCESSPCQNEGVCIEIDNRTDYTCICQGGYRLKPCPGT